MLTRGWLRGEGGTTDVGRGVVAVGIGLQGWGVHIC